MTDKKNPRLGSRIVLSTLNPASNSDDEDIFLSESIADRPELRVQLKYFTVELKPSRCSAKNNCEKNDCRNIRATGSKSSSVNGQKKGESGKNVSSIEATSCDSFHSCRSTTSIQELTGKGNDNGASSITHFGKLVSGSKRIRDDDLLNNLTMVNAIFLSKSVSDSTQHDESNKNQQEKVYNHCKSGSLRKSHTPIPSSSNNVCSEAYACQVNHNPRVQYISKICGNNIITKPVVNSFNTFYEKIRGDRLSYTKTSSESFEPVLKTHKSGFEIVEHLNTFDEKNLQAGFNEELPSNVVVENKICPNFLFSNYTKLEIKVPEMKFAEIIPLCDESCLSVVLNQNSTGSISTTDQRRRRTIPGCEDSLQLEITPKSASLVSVESEDNFMDTADTCHGNGDYSDYSYTSNNGKRSSKMFLKNLDDTYLRQLISKSLKKIQNESESNSKSPEYDEYDIFDSDEECNGLNEYKEDDGLEVKSSNSTQLPLPIKKLKLQSCFQESVLDLYQTDLSASHTDDHSLPLGDEYDSGNNSDEQGAELIAHLEPSELAPKPPETGFCKRGIGERTRTLPVIHEEISDESLGESEDYREDNLADDYCLIDSNGRPIHLFDNQGLPLTDNSGRPLRSAQGKLLMNCDQNGIPVVDHDGSIFDMFGLQPHEDRFDPSMAPKMAVCSKLSAGDGRPLLLFDAQGRPLTSVSGTMLVDSSGRGLVRLSTATEHPL